MKLYYVQALVDTVLVSEKELSDIDAVAILKKEVDSNGISVKHNKSEVTEVKTLDDLPEYCWDVIPWGQKKTDFTVVEILQKRNSCDGKIVEIEGKKYKLKLIDE